MDNDFRQLCFVLVLSSENFPPSCIRRTYNSREWFAAGCRSAGNSTKIYINKADGIFVKNARLIDEGWGEKGGWLIFYFKSSTIGTPVMCIIFPAIFSVQKKYIYKWHIIFFLLKLYKIDR